MLASDMADTIETAELRIAEVIGSLMEFWGFKAVMGRLWAILYLSPEPLSAAELGERLAISTGGISMALNDLQKWGVVKKAWRPGERRDFYEPETSIWKMVSRVFRERELAKVREAIDAFESAIKAIAQARPRASTEEKKRLKFIEGRLSSLLTLSRIGETLINMLASGEPINPQPIKNLFDRGDD
jgi:HTH-type transcriptional regulator, glycine betaine synthesis regulator